jgi:hypothetical protein
MTLTQSPTVRRRGWPAFLLIVLTAPLAWPAVGHAQRTGLETTFMGGFVLGVPVEFASPISCRTDDADGPAIAARLGHAVMSGLRVQLGVGAQDVFSGPDCIYDPAIPPANGQSVRSRSGDHAEGFIIFPVVAQVEFTPARFGIVEPRLLGGVEWLPAKRMWNPIVGAALMVGRGATRIRVEVDRVWYAIPWLTTVTTYQNSVPVSTETTASTVHARSHRLRIGVSLHPF